MKNSPCIVQCKKKLTFGGTQKVSTKAFLSCSDSLSVHLFSLLTIFKKNLNRVRMRTRSDLHLGVKHMHAHTPVADTGRRSWRSAQGWSGGSYSVSLWWCLQSPRSTAGSKPPLTIELVIWGTMNSLGNQPFVFRIWRPGTPRRAKYIL